jgi:hypothetical protein
MLNRKGFETGDQSAAGGSNGNSEEPKGSGNNSIANSDGPITVKSDHKFSINHPFIIDNSPGKPSSI